MLKDVKIYYQKLETQYLQAKEDLKEFEQAFKDGQITEDRVQCLKDEIAVIETNRQRTAYILHLFNLPRKEEYRKKYKKQNDYLDAYFKSVGADDESVIKEDEDALKKLKEDLKALTNKKE